jgi:transcription termination/antitermination protein NusG
MSIWNNGPCWFALAVRPNHEQTAARGLDNQGLETYLPVHRRAHRWSDRVKVTNAVLFPGYLFCKFGYRDRMRVLQAPGVRVIVSTGGEPIPVEESELAAVRTVLSSGCGITPWPYIRIGQKVKIDSGALAQLRGVIVRVKNSLRVVVSVEALNASIAVELDSGMLTPDTDPTHRPIT